MVTTFQACESIRREVISKGEEAMLMPIDTVSNDLNAVEARYHRTCRPTYISKSNPEYAGFHEGKAYAPILQPLGN